MNTNNDSEILLVEDNKTDEELTIRSLRKHHMDNNVYVVRDGEEALDYIFAAGRYSGRDARKMPRVIFLDLKLPKVDGMEVLRRIRADARTRSTPVVILSSSSEERDVEEGYRLGINSYIVKDVDFEKFSDTVSRLGHYWLYLNRPPLHGIS